MFSPMSLEYTTITVEYYTKSVSKQYVIMAKKTLYKCANIKDTVKFITLNVTCSSSIDMKLSLEVKYSCQLFKLVYFCWCDVLLYSASSLQEV